MTRARKVAESPRARSNSCVSAVTPTMRPASSRTGPGTVTPSRSLAPGGRAPGDRVSSSEGRGRGGRGAASERLVERGARAPQAVARVAVELGPRQLEPHARADHPQALV